MRWNRSGRLVRRWICLALASVTATIAHAQTPSRPLTIGAAVEAARRDYPIAVEASARATAASEAVGEIQASYFPRLDGLWQVNRASRNNVFGLLLPQSIVPPISGPVLGTDTIESAWGSAAGLLFSVEVFDFGRRSAALQAARAQAAAGDATAELARLDAGVAAADAYLSALGAQQANVAARANVSRLETLQRTVTAQVDAELKPGADQSRIDAELASARNQLIATEQTLALARLRLAAAIGLPDGNLALDPGPLLGQPPGIGSAEDVRAEHPAVRAAKESATAAEATREITERLFRPKIVFNAAVAARASGANADGSIDNGQGLWPDVPNWAAGVTVSFPFFDLPANRARSRAESAAASAVGARLIGMVQRSQTEALQARVMMDAALRMAANIPAQVAAAQQAETQARARYEAGLTGIVDVADAQRLLTRAETEAALASLAIWRARLAQAAAEGDLTPFLTEAAKPGAARPKP
jgi:outer membrane protein TolC